MQITLQWLKDNEASKEFYTWAVTYFGVQTQIDSSTLITELLSEHQYDWANFLVLRQLTHSQKIQYGIFASQQCINNFTSAYPNDGRPSEALASAIAYLNNPTPENASICATKSTGSNMAADVANAVINEDINPHSVLNFADDQVKIYNTILAEANSNTSINSAYCAENASNICYSNAYPVITHGYATDNNGFDYAVEAYNACATSQAWQAYSNSIQTNGGYPLANQQYSTAYANAKLSMINYGLSLI